MRISIFSTMVLAFLLFSGSLFAQTDAGKGVVVDYSQPRKYIIGGVRASGINYLSEKQIVSLTGLREGEEIELPSEVLSSIINRIWQQGYFSNVGIYADSLSATKDTVWLRLQLQERPRVSRWKFTGVKSSEREDLEERLKLRRNSELSEYIIKSSENIIKKYFAEKGFLKCEVNIAQVNDTTIKNAVQVVFNVNRGPRVKIKTITFEGNGEDVPSRKLAAAMKKTKDMRLVNFFNSKKFKADEYENDKTLLLQAFHERGYRDAKIVKDSIYYIEDNRMGIHFVIDQGKKYYFRNLTWTGNSVYSVEELNSLMMIKKGDVYDVVTMEKRLYGGGKPNEICIAQLYRDLGYLFFNVVPVETNIVGDSVDVEIRMVEGEQATFNNIVINGNTITNEKVVRRALFTKPGYLFSQTDLERSIREISSMGHFDAEAAMTQGRGWNMIPNPMDNTVDIAYNVEEKSNSQFELSGGWGGNTFVLTLGVSFNNFSIRRLFDKNAWRPVPLGDAQQLSLRFQTNGTYYTAFSLNFTEPWLFGKKPTSFNFGLYYTRQTDSYYWNLTNDEFMEVYGAAVGIGTRLKWPDNYFVLYNELSWQTYKLQNWDYNFLFKTGLSHNFSWRITLNRNSTDQPIYPRSGSDFTLGLQLTPPYSLFRSKDTDYKNMTDQQRYRWIEYHKWTFKGALYTKIIGDLVLMTKAQFGYLGYYNRDLGYSPFEGFNVGGDGMSGYNTYGSEIIGMRGYDNYSLTPIIDDVYRGNVYDKFTIELRYPVILQPQSTIYALAFLEGGNAWSDIRKFNPFSIKRSAGVGVRIFLPMLGLLGLDWGYGFDDDFTGRHGGSHFHFLIGQQF